MLTPLPRVILHLDMDAFYAAVEVREDPTLAGKPLIIGHPGPRGVVATCSYEARRFGVRSAMPSTVAARLCAGATWLPGRMHLYAAVSSRIRSFLDEVSPVVEPLSIDEAFVDLTGIAAGLEAGVEIARALKRRIGSEERLTASVGVAPNKFLAKVASDLEKPDGLTRIDIGDVPARIWPLPVERLLGVGPRTAARLHAAGISTVGALVRSAADLERLVGASGAAALRGLAEGRDDRPVVAHREARSISEERTYGVDLTDPDEIDRELLARADGLARQLRREGLRARTVHIKVRIADFTTWTRARTLPEPTDLAEPLLDTARHLLAHNVPLGKRGVRLLGLSVSGLEGAQAGQGALFEDPGSSRARRAARAADRVRERMGERSMTRARLLRPGRTDRTD